MKGYTIYETITKELLDTIRVGDLIITNYTKVPLRVYGVSPNYFVMARRAFGQWLYSVCEKKPWGGICYNSMRGGMFHIGTDNYVFGNPEGYDFTNPTMVKNYLDSFENGEIKLSMRCSVPLARMAVKRIEEEEHEK